MYQTFADDLLYDLAEGPAIPRRRSAQTYDALDQLDAWDDGDLMGNYADSYGEFEAGDAFDLIEDALVDALEAEDTDEFLRRLRRIARTIARGVGQIARTVAPVARLIPHPAAQAVARVAGAAGRLLADGADELEALDELVDMAEDEYFSLFFRQQIQHLLNPSITLKAHGFIFSGFFRKTQYFKNIVVIGGFDRRTALDFPEMIYAQIMSNTHCPGQKFSLFVILLVFQGVNDFDKNILKHVFRQVFIFHQQINRSINFILVSQNERFQCFQMSILEMTYQFVIGKLFKGLHILQF
jgi:hypothetical protein